MSLSYKLYWPRIRRAAMRGDHERAVRLARRFVRFYPSDFLSWDTLAGALVESGDLAGAHEALEKGDERFPYSWLTYRLATVLMREGRLEEAQSLLERFLDHRPDSPLPHLGLAYLSRASGEDQSVRKHVSRSLELAAEDQPSVHMQIAKLLFLVPGEEARTRELLEGLARQTKEPLPDMYLAVMLESSDPAASQAHRAAALAKIGWTPPGFDGDLDRLRSSRPA